MGYHFIVLGSEDMLPVEAGLSDEQLRWFEEELTAALDTGKPVFIICHQPLYNSNNTFYDPADEKHWGVGEQSEKLTEILKKSPAENAFAVSAGVVYSVIENHPGKSYNDRGNTISRKGESL